MSVPMSSLLPFFPGPTCAARQARGRGAAPVDRGQGPAGPAARVAVTRLLQHYTQSVRKPMLFAALGILSPACLETTQCLGGYLATQTRGCFRPPNFQTLGLRIVLSI